MAKIPLQRSPTTLETGTLMASSFRSKLSGSDFSFDFPCAIPFVIGLPTLRVSPQT